MQHDINIYLFFQPSTVPNKYVDALLSRRVANPIWYKFSSNIFNEFNIYKDGQTHNLNVDLPNDYNTNSIIE